MAPKKRLRMRGVKHSSKRKEDELLETSRRLADDPGLLRPQCAGNCRKCAFDKTFKSIDALQKIRNNPDALVKEASKFGADEIYRAYAGTISLAAAGSVPMLGTATLGGEKISYAVRGTVGADKLIGCQYFTDPRVRLLLYNQFIKKNKLHLYSFGDDLVCSDSPNMPEDYLYDTFWETPYEFKDDGLDCGHSASAVLEIEIKSLKQTVRICENCAKDVSTIQYIISRIAAIDPMDDIEVRVRHKYHAEGEKDYVTLEGDDLKKYMAGLLKDNQVIASVKRSKLGDLKGAEQATYIIGSTNYGSSLDDFIAALTGDEKEIATVKKFLGSNNRAIVIKTNRVTDVLNVLWEADWQEIIATHTDAATAEKMGDQSKGQPHNVLEEAYGIFVSADVVASLPEFSKPGQITVLADKLAKAVKAGGTPLLVKTAQSVSLRDSKMRAVTAAFLMNSGTTEYQVKLSPDEKEFAEYLKPFVKTLVNANGEKYRDAMNTLLTASSSGEKVRS